jgi:hypothetical protein
MHAGLSHYIISQYIIPTTSESATRDKQTSEIKTGHQERQRSHIVRVADAPAHRKRNNGRLSAANGRLASLSAADLPSPSRRRKEEDN